jgi:hypothetical protein
MTQVEILEATRTRAGGYKVDVSRSERIGRVSSEWFSRPADERYLSLSDLFAAVRGRTERSRTRNGGERSDPGRSRPRQRRAPDADAARFRHADRADPLELRPAREPGRRSGSLPASTPGTARRHQPAIRPDLASCRAGQNAGDRRRPCRVARRHRAGLRPYLRSRAGRGRAAHRR